jgi:hypothetical protein
VNKPNLAAEGSKSHDVDKFEMKYKRNVADDHGGFGKT